MPGSDSGPAFRIRCRTRPAHRDPDTPLAPTRRRARRPCSLPQLAQDPRQLPALGVVECPEHPLGLDGPAPGPRRRHARPVPSRRPRFPSIGRIRSAFDQTPLLQRVDDLGGRAPGDPQPLESLLSRQGPSRMSTRSALRCDGAMSQGASDCATALEASAPPPRRHPTVTRRRAPAHPRRRSPE